MSRACNMLLIYLCWRINFTLMVVVGAGGGPKVLLSNGIGFKRQTLHVPTKMQHPPVSPVPLLNVCIWELKAVFLHHHQKANHKHLSAVLVKQNMTSKRGRIIYHWLCVSSVGQRFTQQLDLSLTQKCPHCSTLALYHLDIAPHQFITLLHHRH